MVVSHGRLPSESSSDSIPKRDRIQMRSEPMKDTAATGVSQICAASCVRSSRTASGAELSTSYWLRASMRRASSLTRRAFISTCAIVGYVQIIAHSYFSVSNGLRLWQHAALPGCWWLIGAGVEGDFPRPIGQLFPYGEVASRDHDGSAVLILRAALIVAPGEAHGV